MTPKELKKIAKTMRSLGVLHYKCGDVELNLGPTEPKPVKPTAAPVAEKPITPEEVKEIEHKLEEMTSVLGLGDEALLNRLFPDTQPSDEVS